MKISKKNRFIIIAVLIILLSFILRIYSPTSELPPDISISGSIYTDEGNQCHNSRSRVLYGEWFPDDWKITNYNPVVPYLKYFIFKKFGVGLVQVRAVSFLFALLSLIVFYLILRSYFHVIYALVGIALLGFNFLFTMYNRIGTFETPMIFWMILSVYFLEMFRKKWNLVFPVLSALSAFMAFVFKMTGAHFVPVPAAALVLLLFIFGREWPGNRRKIKRGILIVVITTAAAFAIWLVLFYLPNREWINSAPGSYIGNQMFPKSLKQVAGNILAFNWKEQFYKMWVVWSFSLLYLPFFFRRLLKKITNITEISMVLFLLSHTAALMIMNHRPTRYLIAAIPPMVFLSVHAAYEVIEYFRGTKERVETDTAAKINLFILDVLWLALSSYYCFFPLMKRFFGIKPPVGFSPNLFFLSAGAVILVYMVALVYRGMGIKRYIFGYPALGILIILFFSSVFTNMRYYYLWDRDKTSYIKDISLELGEKIDNGYIAGLTAPVAVLENRHRSLFLYPKFVHWEKNTLAKYSITHALLANFNFEITNFFVQWPDKMSGSTLLNVYNVKDQFLHLYSFVDPYIEDINITEDKKLSVRVINNGSSGEIRLSKILIKEGVKPGGKSVLKTDDIPGVRKIRPGSNDLYYFYEENVESSIFSPLYYIKDELWRNTFRYEGKNFPRKTGKELRDKNSSGKYVRYFNPGIHGPGFISCSNSGKFIPYMEGIMKVDFILKFKNPRSRILPLAVLDIFNNSDRKSSVSRKIKKRDITGDGFNKYSLFVEIDKLTDIEFRVFATGLSEIFLDYIEVTYFQGKFLHRKE